jgi:peptidoglycan-N-acetylglucosamine deacetylase
MLLLVSILLTSRIDSQSNAQPTIAFSFDDGRTDDMPNYKGEIWNNLIIDQLKKNQIQSVLFVSGRSLDNEKGKAFLEKWNEAGNYIANHTYSHPGYNDTSMTCAAEIREILKCDSVINGYLNYQKIFRFPFLKVGNTIAKRDSICAFLKQNGYKQGWVTIDNSDWYICSRLLQRLRSDPQADISGFRAYYINSIFKHAQYYENLSMGINHRHIPHTLLLHINLTSALFLSDLIEKFKKEGWNIVNYSVAIKDPIYDEIPSAMPSDQSLIWSQALKSGLYKNILRYPGEDGVFEKDEMDKLGL